MYGPIEVAMAGRHVYPKRGPVHLLRSLPLTVDTHGAQPEEIEKKKEKKNAKGKMHEREKEKEKGSGNEMKKGAEKEMGRVSADSRFRLSRRTVVATCRTSLRKPDLPDKVQMYFGKVCRPKSPCLFLLLLPHHHLSSSVVLSSCPLCSKVRESAARPTTVHTTRAEETIRILIQSDQMSI